MYTPNVSFSIINVKCKNEMVAFNLKYTKKRNNNEMQELTVLLIWTDSTYPAYLEAE